MARVGRPGMSDAQKVLDLLVTSLEVAVTGKRLLRVRALLPYPTAQHVRIQAEFTCDLLLRSAFCHDLANSLQLELSREAASRRLPLHATPPAGIISR